MKSTVPMKFLGECDAVVAILWQRKLAEEFIFPTTEEVGGYLNICYLTMGTFRPKVRLFVEEHDYAKAVGLIKELEQNLEKEVEKDSKAANRVMLRILLGIIVFIALTIWNHKL